MTATMACLIDIRADTITDPTDSPRRAKALDVCWLAIKEVPRGYETSAARHCFQAAFNHGHHNSFSWRGTLIWQNNELR